MPSNEREEGLLEEPTGSSGSTGYTNRDASAGTGQDAVVSEGGASTDYVETTDRSAVIEGDQGTSSGTDYVTSGDLDTSSTSSSRTVNDDSITVTTRNSQSDDTGFVAQSSGTQMPQGDPAPAEERPDATVFNAAAAEPLFQDNSRTESVSSRGPQAVDDDTTVELHEEELRADTVERQAGEVRVSKDVVEEEQTLEVPVSREQVRISSRPVTDQGSVDTSQAFQGGTISVPVREEDVEVRKEVRVAEELEIDKTVVQDTERVTDTVRREEVNIEQVGDVDVEGGSTGGTIRS